jgi:hypothetical protein
MASAIFSGLFYAHHLQRESNGFQKYGLLNANAFLIG